MIVDASVAVKWFVPEAGHERALACLERAGEALLAPELIRVEVAAAFTRKYRHGFLSREAVLRAMSQWRDYLQLRVPILREIQDLIPLATEISLDIHHPFQDCCYLALAQSLNRPLITADLKLSRHAAHLNIPCELIHSTH